MADIHCLLLRLGLIAFHVQIGAGTHNFSEIRTNLSIPYPNPEGGSRSTDPVRAPIPKSIHDWSEVTATNYHPNDYTSREINPPRDPYCGNGPTNPPWADYVISTWSHFKWNCFNDTGINRMSFEGNYTINSAGIPLNPAGPTGMTGRGVLGRWAVNHEATPLVTRFICKEEYTNKRNPSCYQVLLVTGKTDGNISALPASFVNSNEDFEHALVRTFGELAMNTAWKTKFPKRVAALRAILDQLVKNPKASYTALEQMFINLKPYFDDIKALIIDTYTEAKAKRIMYYNKYYAARTPADRDPELDKKWNYYSAIENKFTMAYLTIYRITSTSYTPPHRDDVLKIFQDLYKDLFVLLCIDYKDKIRMGEQHHHDQAQELERLSPTLPLNPSFLAKHHEMQQIMKNFGDSIEKNIASNATGFGNLTQILTRIEHEIESITKGFPLDMPGLESTFKATDRSAVYSGYAGDIRDTDNAWVEVRVRHMRLVLDLSLRVTANIGAGGYVTGVTWATLMPNMTLFAYQGNYVHEIYNAIAAGQYITFSKQHEP